MTTLKSIIIILTITTLCSCKDSSTNKTSTIQTDSIDSSTKSIYKIANSDLTSPKDNEVADTITTIKFNELSISINRLYIYDEGNRIDQIQKDTVKIYEELGETIEGKLIFISDNQLTGLTIEQRYETSVIIMNEGPHCDLTDWKHFYSDWKRLQPNSTGQFICEEYSEEEYKIFPKTSIDDLKNQVKEKCGEDWLKLVQNIKTPTEYPSAVSISRYFLRVTGQRKDNGQTVTKLIIIETPMGC